MRTHNTNVFDDNDTLLAPSYNIAPQTLQPVVKLARDTGQRKLAAIRLGLIPYCVLVERCEGCVLDHQRKGRDHYHQPGIP